MLGIDFATGKKINTNLPEEKTRQKYEQILCQDYDYPKKNIDIEVTIQRGSQRKEKADIVIFNDSVNREQHKDILGIVETKSIDKKDGVAQLISYMSACSCTWGVWTNGEDIEYLYKSADGQVKKNFIFNIPKYGESIETIGYFDKSKLRPIKNLKPIFKKILTTLYSNTNISRKEKLGSEMIKIIFCKLWDEKYKRNSIPDFRFEQKKTNDLLKNEYSKCASRIKKLFSSVKEDIKEDNIFLPSEGITLDDKSISQVVAELQNYSLLNTEKDVIGEAFEVFAESKLVGEKGEFFTPREVIRLAVNIIKPTLGSLIIDPACGSGGFLVYVLDYLWKSMINDKRYSTNDEVLFSMHKKEMAEKCIYGIYKEHDLVRIAKAYMTILGDGKSKIVQENTLHPLQEFQTKSKELLLEDNQLKKFDYVVTNPPFGSKIKVNKHDSKYFDLGHKYKYEKETNAWVKTEKVKETPPQELFIERCINLLKDGGTLAIILPETYFHAPTKKHILQYIKQQMNISHIIDLPHNTFRPYCNAKTCLLIAKKQKQQGNIAMGIAENMGHDHRGETIYRVDKQGRITNEIWDDTKNIEKELENIENKKNIYTFALKKDEINYGSILVPRYYWKHNITQLEEEAKKHNIVLIPVQKFIDENIIKVVYRGHGSPKSELKGFGDIPYVRVDDVVNWGVYKNPASMIPESEYNRVKGNKENLQENDIIFVKEGSYRIGSVALLTKYDLDVLVNSHCYVLRVNKQHNDYGIDPHYLMYLFSNHMTQKQLYNKIMIDTTLPNIGERWRELLLPIHKCEKKKEQIKKSIKDIFNHKNEINKEMSMLSEYGKFIT